MRRGHELVPLALLALLAAAGCHKARVVNSPSPSDTLRTTGTPSGRNTPGGTTTNPGDVNAAREAEQKRLRDDIGGPIHFDYDQDAIKPEERVSLDRKADIMKANPALRIRITGHADERGSDEYNLVLGNKRALAAKQYLMSKGIDGSRMQVGSMGEEKPADPGMSEASFAVNRRDEFEILSGGERLVPPR